MNEFMRRVLFLPEQASTMSADIDHLHYFVILTTMMGATLVTLAGGWLVIRYRRRSTREKDPPREEPAPTPPIWLEWSVIVGLFSLFLFMWVIGFRQYTRLRVAPPESMVVYVTAKQWMWKFGYADGGRSISTLYVPAGRPVKLVMTSRDVIHSFYVPDFRIKQDVVPGRYTTVWFEVAKPGAHQILCAEYCGASHSTMRGDVVALDEADWARFQRGARLVSEPVAPTPYVEPATVENFATTHRPLDLAAAGRVVAANQGCLRCHTLDGTPHIGPTWAGLYRSAVPLDGGATVTADEAYLTESMMDPRAKLHAGYQPVMPTYLGRLTPYETAALVELIKSLADVPPRPRNPDEPPLPNLVPAAATPAAATPAATTPATPTPATATPATATPTAAPDGRSP